MENFDRNEISRLVYTTPKVERELVAVEEAVFDQAKEQLLIRFNTHPVTIEIEGGIDSDNISNTLQGRGNLFSFIGFPEGSQPIIVIRQILNELLVLKNPIKRLNGRNGFEYVFPVAVPIDEIIEATPLPFESGNSWVVGIEEGIAGFSNFLFRVSQASRSGKGIETKNGQIFPGVFQPVPYLISLLSNFTETLGDNNFIII